ncbi:MAG: FtsQ-type POTRA domain-containing protein [Peptoniphilus sp.]|nr:FtsQ-type POTRA domain-containing protein [Peptoniphilus sp.]MDD7363136.1 FtsQ-type POTRA domain-containing protein [Bacillota bacterium]MDY6044342.1 FtsQ-type POTRA domain-containing protein [Peptoniphilus sp.]
MTDVRKKKNRRKLKRKYRNRRILLVVVLALLITSGVAFFSSATAMTDVAITGTKTVSKTEVRQIAEGYLNKSYLRMDKKSLANRLEQLPYVKRADLGLSFPHTLKITIEEEKPAAQIYSGDGYILVNEDFRALEKTRSYHTNLVKITGIPTEGVRPGQVAFHETDNEKKTHMIETLFKSELKEDMNTLSILDQGVKLSFSDGTIVHIRSLNDAEYKVKQLEEIRKEMKLKNEDYREIFLDQGDHPIAVRPSSIDDEEEDTSNEATSGDIREEESLEKSSNDRKSPEEKQEKRPSEDVSEVSPQDEENQSKESAGETASN